MTNFQKIGGVAALIEAATFVFGLALFFTILAPYGAGELDPAQTVAFLLDNRTIMYVWNQVIYVVFGIFLVVLSLALHARLQAGAPAVMQVATAFGLIWAGLVIASGMVFNLGVSAVVARYGQDQAQAATVWLAISAVQDGLGGGNEIVGGVWVLLLSWGALRAGGLPSALNYLGVVLGVAGLLTVVPAFDVLTAIFGLGLIVWFAWVGVVMLRSTPAATELRATAATRKGAL